MKNLLLIVEDDQEIRTQLRWALAADYEILQAEDRFTAIELFKAKKPSVVLLDLGLPPQTGTPAEGLAALAEILEIERRTKVIISSGQNERETALKAVAGGAYDFLNKPVDPVELKFLLKRCFHVSELEREAEKLRLALGGDGLDGILGSSAVMQAVFAKVRKVATSEAPVLILGESGTGKEMVARSIHLNSARSEGPFVAINCSAIPEALLESELFGHEKGAFTGAQTQRKGRIEHAAGGTLFLDEVGEIATAIQVKLLRFLQEQTIERVGGRGEIKVDTRVLAATNADLAVGIKAGTFREDFFYRIAVVRLNLPPLRDRGEDVRLIAQSYLHRYAAENGRKGLSLSGEALKTINAYPWPGNIRELQNRVRRAVILGNGPRLTSEDLELSSEAGPAAKTLKEAREDLERSMIQRTLGKHGGKIAPTAVELGVSRPTLYDLMEKLGLGKAPEAE